jgi:signal transduction histidine kinase
MTIKNGKTIKLHAFIGVLILAIFILDCMTPLGIADWFLYSIPIFLAGQTTKRFARGVIILIVALLAAGFFLSPPGAAWYIALFNRITGFICLTFIGFASLRQSTSYKKLMESEKREQQGRKELEGITSSLEQKVKERTRKISALSKALTIAEQRERLRFSQMLHEGLQQILFSVKLHLDTLECGKPGHPEAGDIEMIKENIVKAIRASNSIAIELNPPILKTEGLDSAIRWLASQMAERLGLKIEADVSAELSKVKEVDRILVIQLLRELIFNVAQHAKSPDVRISARKLENTVAVTVEDKGIGFDVQSTRGRDLNTFGMGLFSIEERLRLFDGSLEIRSEPSVGTMIKMILPIDDNIETGEK